MRIAVLYPSQTGFVILCGGTLVVRVTHGPNLKKRRRGRQGCRTRCLTDDERQVRNAACREKDIAYRGTGGDQDNVSGHLELGGFLGY
ncbi:MAG: hypothetical protein OJF52_001349 [Nitrospira sp.]|nr:MAG: hypothetical protein OJF52_001349 [Nitrospira sp.]